MSHSLTIKPAGSFMKDRKINNGESTERARRYRFTVHGPEEVKQILLQDIEDGFIGAAIDPEYGLVFYSWEPMILSQMSIKRGKEREGDEFARWFMDFEKLDALESATKRNPALMKMLGDKIWDEMFNKKSDNPVQDEVETPERERNLDE